MTTCTYMAQRGRSTQQNAVAEALAQNQSSVMADSKMAEPKKICEDGIITKAMALRVKYRKVDPDDRVVKYKIPIGQMGCHPKNRGGCFPLVKGVGPWHRMWFMRDFPRR